MTTTFRYTEREYDHVDRLIALTLDAAISELRNHSKSRFYPPADKHTADAWNALIIDALRALEALNDRAYKMLEGENITVEEES